MTVKKIIVGARNSPLAKAQVTEIEKACQIAGIEIVFSPVWIETTGDKDKKKSLRELDKSNFFTKELDDMVLNGSCDIAIHSAKDLPDPLADGLSLITITKGVDSRDALVFHKKSSFAALQKIEPIIGTCSKRREEMVQLLLPNARFIDIRGVIQERLQLIEERKADAIVVAEAALLRLHLTDLPRVYLPGPSAPLQGKLAITARKDAEFLRVLFAPLDDR